MQLKMFENLIKESSLNSNVYGEKNKDKSNPHDSKMVFVLFKSTKYSFKINNKIVN